MEDAPKPIDRLMAAVSSDPRVSVPVADLAGASGVEPGELASAIREAIRAKLLQRWTVRAGVECVTLAPAVASGLGLEIDHTGKHWRPAGTRSRYDARAASRDREKPFTDFYGENADRAAEMIEARPSYEPPVRWPLFFVGMDHPWARFWDPREACPGCGDRPLPPRTDCLVCDAPLGAMGAKTTRRVNREEWNRAQKEAGLGPALSAGQVEAAKLAGGRGRVA